MWTLWIAIGACAYILLYLSRTQLYAPMESELTFARGKVTLLVCLHNEASEIDAFIEAILEQEYQDKQLLLVDDRSTDESLAILKKWEAAYPEVIKVLHLDQKKIAGKKGAVKAALPYIKGEYLLFTDVDCRPNSPYWINYMIAPLQLDNIEVTLGVVLVKSPLNLWGMFRRFQSFWKSIQFLGFAQRRWAYMAMGGNWAVQTDRYLQNENIEEHAELASGDDDLVFQALNANSGTEVILDPKSWVKTKEKGGFFQNMRQRGRHMSTYKAYKWKWNLLLLSAPVVMLVGIICIFLLLSRYPLVAMLLITIYYISALRVMAASAKVIPAGFSIFLAPLLLPFEFLLQGIGFLVTLSRNQSNWS